MSNLPHPGIASVELDEFQYDNRIVRNFAIATILFGLIGMLVGLLAALQLVFPDLNMDIPYLTFSRIRPLHTNAVIFAFVGNGFFTGLYYSAPRVLRAPMWSPVLSRFHFWAWQFIILAAAITLPMGLTTSKEYAELEWPIDIAIAVVWVSALINLVMTTINRRTEHIYAAVWFYIASFVTVAMLHVVNSIALPISLFKSYSVYAGVQDALVQWWYGHNAVAFFLTTPYLGLMYYFLPKAANRPIYSYRLSIVHFWALIFLYIWAGPHHLLYTSLPEWAQTLGTVFSVMLIAPSWGGMINGLMTLRGAWDRVREDVVLKFFVVAITAYGMATFEGPMLSFKNVNAIAHYTDWIVAHVHVGALGWNGFLTFGLLYWLFPRLYNRPLYSQKAANFHFWIGTLGIIFYTVPMYWAGWVQSSMWQEFTQEGLLKYPNFLETVTQLAPLYFLRSVGGTLYLIGFVVMIYNLWMTALKGKLVPTETAKAMPLSAIWHASKNEYWHRRIFERKPLALTIFALIAVAIGGMIEMIPTFMIKSNVPTIAAVKPYTPLELQGRDIYVREGCYVCHTQMIRPFRAEIERYGEYSKSGEFVYDFPHQWGSKRTGPDVHRVGGKYPDSWHYNHMEDPTSMSPGSIMPRYGWLLEDDLDTSNTAAKIRAMQTLGVPYEKDYDKVANADLTRQAKEIQGRLKQSGIKTSENKEIIALIAYLQRLGTDIKTDKQ
ncbi:cytochrome-c oxidase, cbb3-type subunit I [Dyadobacter sp. CY312]|uniref:cytochrome-c oxidase, cbb3-type subunit I n=1 Tax=Dyadobacter sp. CY312 TaxID=2907303 RepID=UPI001F3B8C80|nr:cytochrome-c oxidase, cbb3-type subunit I [Dyadobacter sp. CY312]MCE7040823.1 cytochrome-c oxidase, cbb3-type subunit I [Dyadobacter sp. CY312]